MVLDLQLTTIIALTFIIHLIGTLAYAFRLAGVRTGHLSIAFSLFNTLVLISRLSNAIQGPLLAKRVELVLAGAAGDTLRHDLTLIVLAASAATLTGAVLLPTFQRLAFLAVEFFYRRRSMLGLVRRVLSPSGASTVLRSMSLPGYLSIKKLTNLNDLPLFVIVLNFAATALWTVGVLASIYAGVLTPELRVTAASLSSLVNGVATVIMFVMIDPHLSAMTDDAASGRTSQDRLKSLIFWMIASRFAGTLVAQVLLEPAAFLISRAAIWL